MKEDKRLVADGIEFNYRDHPVLRGAYLRLERGTICGLVGRNGCGKSTLMKVIAGELRQGSGIVMISQERFAESRRRERYAHLAFLPQDFMTPGRMRVQRLLALLPESVRHIASDPLIEKILETRIDRISTGEHRYLEAMIVLNLDREYILLDEPFTGLSPIMIEHLSSHIRNLAEQGTGILLSDHYTHYVLPLIDRCWIMQNGQCQELSEDEPFGKQLEQLGYVISGGKVSR